MSFPPWSVTKLLPFCCGLALISAWPAAAGFKLVPIEANFRPSGAEAVQSFRVENPDAETVAIQISIAQRTMDAGGADQLVPDEASFVVVPQQILLKPQQVQSIRVQYVGSSELRSEMAYRLVAEQIPLDAQTQEAGGKLRLLVRYVASLYVAPTGARSDLAVETVQPATAADGSPRLAVTVINRGNAHQILVEPTLLLRGAVGAPIETRPPELSSQNFLAGSRRQFLIAVPAGLGEGPFAAEIRHP